MVVGPQRRVAERLAAPRQLARDLRVEPGRDAEPAGGGQPSAPRSRSSSATHSMWGVWGNMSTGADLNEPVAGVDHLARVRRQRGRVAGDVDDPAAGCVSSSRRTTFCDSPARGGSTTTTSGRGARSASGRSASRTSPAKKWTFSISFSARVLDRVRDRLVHDVHAPHLAGAQRERQAERADPAEEVVARARCPPGRA